MRRVKIFLISLLSFALLFAMTACGGNGTVDGFVNAVKKLDFEKANSYCVQSESDEDIDVDISLEVAKMFSSVIDAEMTDLEDFCGNMLRDLFADFQYTVDAEEENADGSQKILEITYTNIDAASTMMIFSMAIAAEQSGYEAGKVAFDVAKKRWNMEMDFAKKREKIEGTTSLILSKVDQQWKLNNPEVLMEAMLSGSIF